MKRPKPGAAQGEAERLAGLICSLCLVLRGYDYSSRYCTLAAKMQSVPCSPGWTRTSRTSCRTSPRETLRRMQLIRQSVTPVHAIRSILQLVSELLSHDLSVVMRCMLMKNMSLKPQRA